MSKATTEKNNTFNVSIHGQQWKIQLLRNDAPELNYGKSYGICVFNTYTIYLGEEINDNLLSVTLFHEIMHAHLAIISQLPENERTEEVYADHVGFMMAEVLPQISTWPVSVRKRLGIK